MDDVFIRSGKQPEYLEWSTDASGNPVVTTAAPGSSKAIPKGSVYSTFQCVSAAAATCVIEGTNDVTSVGQAINGLFVPASTNNWVLIGTITLAGAGSDGITSQAPWRWVRARLTTATATTYVIMGT